MANEQDKKPVDIEKLTEQLEELSDEDLKNVAGGVSRLRVLILRAWGGLGGEGGGDCSTGSGSSGVRG